MAHKIFCLGMALVFAVMAVGCDKKTADVPVWIQDLPPEDVLQGIGIAKTESDGESILLAEDRARTEIARQLDTKVSAYAWEDQSLDITHARTSTVVNGSRVVRRYKDKNGAWWCMVWLPRAEVASMISKANEKSGAIELAQNDIWATLPTTLRSNMENRPDIKNAVTLKAIPGWVFDDGPEDMICGVGAAQLDNDEDAVYLAMERARRSLARALSAEINATISDYYVSGANETLSYFEEGVSISSVYEYTPMQMRLLDLAKTKDGTVWVLVAKDKDNVSFNAEERMNRALEGAFSAEERMNQAFERAFGETQQ